MFFRSKFIKISCWDSDCVKTLNSTSRYKSKSVCIEPSMQVIGSQVDQSLPIILQTMIITSSNYSRGRDSGTSRSELMTVSCLQSTLQLHSNQLLNEKNSCAAPQTTFFQSKTFNQCCRISGRLIPLVISLKIVGRL